MKLLNTLCNAEHQRAIGKDWPYLLQFLVKAKYLHAIRTIENFHQWGYPKGILSFC